MCESDFPAVVQAKARVLAKNLVRLQFDGDKTPITNPATINLRSQSFLVIVPDGRSTLITDNWQADAAPQSHADVVECFDWYTEERPAVERKQLAVQTLLSHLGRMQPVPKCVGIKREVLKAEATEEMQSAIPAVEFQNVWNDLTEMRRSKYSDEVQYIRRAVHACGMAYDTVRGALLPGVSELEMYATAFRSALIDVGEPIAAMGDFISGVERTGARTGELFITDFFVLVGGYRGDLCNTFVAGEEPTQEQHQRFRILEQAQVAAEARLRPGNQRAENLSNCRRCD